MPVDIRMLRAHFPVLEHTAYFNAGTDGPLPAAAAHAGARELLGEAERGRAREHFERRAELAAALRAGYARALCCEPEDVALTTCTTEGLSIVIDGLELGEGDEILTSEEEHPGLLGVLAAAREVNGAIVRMVPLERIDEEVGPSTRLVACSHVSWMT
ncbi:MAG TPA: aminotransferase class V-fold PLP-dependent enzyme, partial [Solirubrobacteraceae bacterium]